MNKASMDGGKGFELTLEPSNRETVGFVEALYWPTAVPGQDTASRISAMTVQVTVDHCIGR